MFGLQEGISLLPWWAEYLIQPPVSAQLVFTVIIVITFGLIATERLHRTVAALGGAVATLIAGGYFSWAYSWVPYFTFIVSGGLVSQELLFSYSDVYQDFIDWSTLLIIISIVVITTVASRSGLFEYIIIKVIKFSGGDIKRLFIYLWALTFILTMVLNCDPSFIIVSVLVFQICRVLDLNPVPYVLGTVFVVNAASVSTLIGSFVNILVTGSYNLDPTRFLSYPTFLVLGVPFAVICTVIALFFIFRHFKGAFEIPKEKEGYLETREELLSFNERSLVRDPKMFRRLAILLGVTIAGFVIAGLINLPFYVVSLLFAFAFVFVSGEDPEKTLREVDWSLIFFFIGIFIIVGGVDRTKILEILGNSLGGYIFSNVPGTATVVTLFCGTLSGILDNISVTTALLFVTPSLASSALISENLVIWSLIYGANIGASLTPIGGLPNLIAITALEKQGFHVSWREFMKIGVPITLLSISIGIPLLLGFAHILGWGLDFTGLFTSMMFG
ncbi:MAG: SLC13 family permease [Candidatus Jordarchaeum sp.]|uniref:ArsB/NhaD family transporter n=1 Tax=Candidatus Jordarchaeum sp. TaxID=2823881 RepID=UPI00404ADA86